MFRISAERLASLRYRRPYWMLFLKDVDNWRIYTVIHQPDHQRTEMLYQAWLGGLDRPYVRPKCMAHQPLWLTKKRHMMQRARLEGPETALEKYVLEWYRKFHSFNGTERPTAEDLHTAFDLVERPLDLSYACQMLNQCRNHFNIRFTSESFVIFLEACLRVDRKDCAIYALDNAEKLGFWFIDDNCRRYLNGKQSWYRLSLLDNLYYPIEENEELNQSRSSPEQTEMYKWMTSHGVFTNEKTSTPTTEATITKSSTTIPHDDKDAESMTDTSDAIGDTICSATDDSMFDIEHSANVNEGAKQMSEEDEELARLEAELRALEDEMSANVDDSTNTKTNVDNTAPTTNGDNSDRDGNVEAQKLKLKLKK